MRADELVKWSTDDEPVKGGMFRTKASVAICGVLGVLALLFYVDSRFAAQACRFAWASTSVRPAQQSSIDYQSLWSAAHCTNPAVAQSLTPEQIANTARIEEMVGPPGILVPYNCKARATAGEGRRLYATKPIPKGTMIIQCNRELRFDAHDEWKAFVACIPDVKLKSDVARWAWPTQSDSGGQWVMLSLDDGSLTNHCARPTMGPHWSESDSDPDDSDSTDVRVRIGRQMIPSVQNTFALRDIEPGEELCDNYSTYGADESKHWFGNVSALDEVDR